MLYLNVNIWKNYKFCIQEPDSSDEDDVRERYRVEIIPTIMATTSNTGNNGTTGTVDRRKMFAKSKSFKTCCSMPAPVSINFLKTLVYREKFFVICVFHQKN